MKVTTAMRIIDNALVSYCENDITSDPAEQARTEKAWKAIKGAITVAQALVKACASPARDPRVPEIGGYDPELDEG